MSATAATDAARDDGRAVPVAVVEHVTKRFGPIVAVDDVSVTVEPGEVVGLLGANGAGKTTTIRMLLGLLTPTSGRVAIAGHAPDRRGRRHVGYVPQGLGLYADLSVVENLRFVAGAFGTAVPVLPDDLAEVAGVPVGALPLGVRRRVAFLAALSHHPALLVLDEPTSGVGPVGRAALWDTIHATADRGAAVLVTTHYMDEAEQCDRLVVMADGRAVASGTVPEIVGAREVVEITTDGTAAVLARLEARGHVAVPTARGVRVVTGDTADVAAAVADPAADVRAVPATLEEAFVSLVSADR